MCGRRSCRDELHLAQLLHVELTVLLNLIPLAHLRNDSDSSTASFDQLMCELDLVKQVIKDLNGTEELVLALRRAAAPAA